YERAIRRRKSAATLLASFVREEICEQLHRATREDKARQYHVAEICRAVRWVRFPAFLRGAVVAEAFRNPMRELRDARSPCSRLRCASLGRARAQRSQPFSALIASCCLTRSNPSLPLLFQSSSRGNSEPPLYVF